MKVWFYDKRGALRFGCCRWESRRRIKKKLRMHLRQLRKIHRRLRDAARNRPDVCFVAGNSACVVLT